MSASELTNSFKGLEVGSDVAEKLNKTANDAILNVFILFPSPYTQALLHRALTSHLPRLNLLPELPESPPTPLLLWCDYDILPHELLHSASASTTPTLLASSYIYRKSLIRKHYLHNVIQEYLAKHEHRQAMGSGADESPLTKGIPRGWTIDVAHADELDELFCDELYELAEDMQKEEGERGWWILKPGMSDKGMGIRIFSTREELNEIFEEMEPESSDEEDEDENEDDETGVKNDDDDDDEFRVDGVMTSQLRHFVIQEYLPNPLLLAPQSGAAPGIIAAPANHKFHLRCYFLLSSSYDLLLSRTTLALFSSLPYNPPRTAEESLLPHLTNTCLQPPMSPGEVDEGNVFLLWELEGRLAQEGLVLTKEVLERIWEDVGKLGAEAVKAAVECGSVHMQLLPNCFEIFGVDFLLSIPPASSAPVDVSSHRIHATLLEFNASPDFHQSGERLQPHIKELFDGVVKEVVAPYFDIREEGENEGAAVEAKPDWAVGDERSGWKCFGKGDLNRGW